MIAAGMTADEESLWMADRKDKLLYKIEPEDGTTIKSFKAQAKNARGGSETLEGTYNSNDFWDTEPKTYGLSDNYADWEHAE